MNNVVTDFIIPVKTSDLNIEQTSRLRKTSYIPMKRLEIQ